MLNQRQERFCLEYITNSNATEAAIKAGYSPRTAQVIASQNLSKIMIRDRIQELQLQTTNPKIADVIERKEILTQIAQDAHKQPITAQDKVRAISELNKMEGDYAPEKHAVLGDIEITIVHKDKGG